jgi:hypothetical protein
VDLRRDAVSVTGTRKPDPRNTRGGQRMSRPLPALPDLDGLRDEAGASEPLTMLAELGVSDS